MSMISINWYTYLLAQIASESYLDGIDLDDDSILQQRLENGANHFNFVDQFTPDQISPTQMTDVMIADFSKTWTVIDHLPNTTSGFSATVLYSKITQEFTISFRSTESKPATLGGDVERDSKDGANGELSIEGFAYAQLLDMEEYFSHLRCGERWDEESDTWVADPRLDELKTHLNAGGSVNVTGYSLGGHLAQIFTRLHYDSVIHTYIFNGAGFGDIEGASGGDDYGSLLRERLATLKAAMANPSAFLDQVTITEFGVLAAAIGGFDFVSKEDALRRLLNRREELLQSSESGQFNRIYDDPLYQYALKVLPDDTRGALPITLEEWLGISGDRQSDDEKITNIHGLADPFDPKVVAGSGQIFGSVIDLFVEDQPEVLSLFNPIDVDDILRSLGPTHSITLLADTLALMEIFQRFDPNLQLAEIREIFSASSNSLAKMLAIGDSAEGDSLENALDALGELFFPGDWKPSTVDSTAIGFKNLDNRNEYFNNINRLRTRISELYPDGITGITVSGLATLSEGEMLDIAKTSIAHRYSLVHLNPFVIEGDDSLYDADLLAIENFSDDYLRDRAEFFVLKNALYTANESVLDTRVIDETGLEGTGSDRRYDDLTSGTILREDGTLGDNEQRYVFGTDFSDGEINGGDFDDHFYGGGGHDALNGLGGDDHLEGGLGPDQLSGGTGADVLFGGMGDDFLFGSDVSGGDDGAADILKGGDGEDSYFVGNGDVINDSDRVTRLIEFNGQRVNGDYIKVAENEYRSDATGLTITVSGSQAVVAEKSGNQVLRSFTIDNFKDEPSVFNNGDYGIRLLEDASGAFIQGSEQRDRIELHDAATRLEILEGSASGQTGTVRLTQPVLGILGNGGDDEIFVVDGARGLFISGDGFEEAEGDGNDFISAVDLEALDAGDIPQDGAFGVTILGQGGDDILAGSLRSDVIRGGTGHDVITGVHGADQLRGGEGNDLVEGNENNDNMQGGEGNDRLLGGADFDVLFGGGGDDRIYGDSDFGTFAWVGESQTISIPDIFWFDPAQEGQDAHTFAIFQDVEVAEADSDFLYGGSGEDRLFGGPGGDFLYGEGDNDTLQGEAGNDRVVGGEGHDILWGDKDPASYDSDVEILDETRDFGTHIAKFITRGHRDGKDVAGDDLLDGGTGNDRMHGGAGNDAYVFGPGYGSDLVVDQSGERDRVQLTFGVAPADVTLEAFGSDVVLSIVDETGVATDRLTMSNWNGSGNIESIEFADGTAWDAQTIAAIVGPFDDDGLGETIGAYFAGGPGDDMVQGLSTNEALYGNQGNDQLQAGAGNDRVFGGTGNDVLFGQAGDDAISGQAGDDQLQGGDGADQLNGNAGDDELFGQNGSDLLSGGVGNDSLFGGASDDVYEFESGEGADVIFEEGDTNGDLLRFGESISPNDVSLSRTGDALLISTAIGTDSVTVSGWFSDPALKLGAIEFADGTVWDVPAIESLLPDSFLLRNGDIAEGNRGPSTYAMDVGVADGFDITIRDAGGVDRLRLDRVLYNTSPFNLFRTPVLDDFTRSGDDLILDLTVVDDNVVATDATGVITIQDYYTEDGFIESIEFANGVVLNSPNQAPIVIGNIEDQSISPDEPYAFSLPADLFADDAFDLLSYRAALADGSILPGWLSFDPATRTFSGTPAESDEGLLEIAVFVTDHAGASASQRFLLNVGNANQNPQPAADSATTPEDSILIIPAADLLGNDSDPNGDELTLTAVGIPRNGSVNLDSSGNVQFTPAPDFNGAASFAYLVEDDQGGFAVDTVSVQVTPVNDAPAAHPDFGVVTTGNTVLIDVLANDTDVDAGDEPSSFTLKSVAVQGSLGNASIAGNQLQFATGADFDFLDQNDSAAVLIEYTMSDSSDAESSSIATITIVGNQDPIANPDSVELYLEYDAPPGVNSITVDVLANDTDPDPNENLEAFTLSGAAVQGPKGAVSILDNKLVFDAGTDFDSLGTGEFEDIVVDYTVTDDGGASASSTATVTVRANRAPAANPDVVSPTVTVGSPQEFLVNTYTENSQTQPDTAAQPDGSFFVVWRGGPLGIFNNGITGQLFDATGSRVGGEIDFALSGFSPAVAALENGRYAVTWGSPGVEIQLVDGQGNKLGGLIEADSSGLFRDKPKITGLPDGGFVVVWQDGGGRRFDAAGNPVATDPIVTLWEPNVTATADGGFYVVSWDVSNTLDVFGQKFDAGGAAGPFTRISNDINQSFTANPQTATLANGNIVVTWTESDADVLGAPFEGKDILGQILSPAGVPLGGNFLINANTFGDQESSAITALPDGGFVVAWHSDGDAGEGFSREIIGQRFDNEGLPVGQPFMVNSFTDNEQILPQISSRPDGTVIVAWQTSDAAVGDSSGPGIAARIIGFEGVDPSKGPVTIDVLANDTDPDPNDGPGTLTLQSVSVRGEQGTASIVDDKLEFTPGPELGDTETGVVETVVIDYVLADDDGATATSTATIHFHDELTIVGTPGDDIVQLTDAHVAVATLEGNDVIDVIASANDVLAKAGPGNDVINLNGKTNASVDTGAGNNLVNVTFSTARSTDITTGSGSNLLSFTFPTLGDPLLGLAAAMVGGGPGPNSYVVDDYLGANSNARISINDRSGGGPAGDGRERNTLTFGSSVSGNVTLSLGSLQINIEGSGLTINLENFDPDNVVNGPRDIDFFEFSDGTVLTYERFVQRGIDVEGTDFGDELSGTNITDRLRGFSGDDRILAGAGNDVLTGGPDNDILDGGADDDVYVFSPGDGQDFVRESGGTDQFIFGEGIDPGSLDIIAPGNDLVLLLGTDDRIVIENWFVDETRRVERFVFNADPLRLLSAAEMEGRINRPPALAAGILDQFTDEDALYRFSIPEGTFTDPDADDLLTFTVSAAGGEPLPSWLSFDQASRTLSGIPENQDVGSIPLEIAASDPLGQTATDAFILTVNNVNDAPVLTAPIVDQSVDEDSPFALTLSPDTFTDIDVGDSLTLSASLVDDNPLPAWLSFDAESFRFSGTPENDDVEVVTVRVTATDVAGAFAEDEFGLTVINVNDPPVATDDEVVTDEDTAILIPGLLLNDVDIDVGDSLFISEIDPSSAAGAAVSLGAIGDVSYDPGELFQYLSADEQAQDSFAYTASDGNGGFSDATVSIVVQGLNDAPFVRAPIEDQTTQEGADFRLNLPDDTFDDVDASDRIVVQASLENGAMLPAWLLFDPDNDSLTGTPPFDAAGEYGVALMATDLDGESTQTSFRLKVINVINGSEKNDTLDGTPDVDIINGFESNDMLSGGGGGDKVNGGPGNDRLSGGFGDDVLDGGPGNDQLFGDQGNDTLVAGGGNDRLLGGSGNDTVAGGFGNDNLMGDEGSDTLEGGPGIDELEGGVGDDAYLFNRGWGQDFIVENDATPGNTDTLRFESDIDRMDLVFRRYHDDLLVSMSDSSDIVAVANWYADSAHQVERIQTSDGGLLLSDQVDLLIQAMATFSADTGLSWEQAVEQRPEEVETILTAYWQTHA